MQCPADNLFSYAQQCFEKPFTNSGLVLQDLVNEFGRRLDFEVENGLYRGKTGSIGFDGVWRTKNQPDIIIEVKTTDYVAMDLDVHARYKDRLLASNRTTKDASTLIIVGREDTGALEAQIRGSRYAWEMRLISVERLMRLVQIKQKADDTKTLDQIRQLLQPFEYTKIDRIIDVIFTTTQEVEMQHQDPDTREVEQASTNREPRQQQVKTSLELLNAKRLQAVEAFSRMKSQPLVKRSTTLFSDPEKSLRVCCAVSKRYESAYQPYWYAYHPAWDEFLAGGSSAYFVLSCMDRDEAYALPFQWLKENRSSLNMTDRGDKSYWHIPITTLPNNQLAINLSRVGSKVPLLGYAYQIATSV